MTFNNQSSAIENFLNSHFQTYIDRDERLDFHFQPSTTLLNDPRSSKLGLVLNSRFEVQPKLAFSVKNKGGRTNLGILEVSTSPLGLKMIGSMQVLARMIEPKYAFILLCNQISKELTYLLADPQMRTKLLGYGAGNEIELIEIT
jgi:hypothetical protein